MPKTRPPTIGPGAVKYIHRKIDEVFDRAKARLLGPHTIGKRLYVGYNHHLSLPGIFEQASREEGAVPNLDTLNQILKVAGGYIDSTRERTKAKAVKEIQAFLTESHRGGTPANFETVLGGKLQDVFSEAADSIRKIVDTEANHAKNVGVLDGIVKLNANAGIEDPTVYFVIVRDRDVCDECVRLHMLPDGKTPRVWKLSEVGESYHRKGEPNPKMGGLHPHCRCTLATLLPGYGFNDAGFVSFIDRNHDEYEKQRGAK